LTDESASDAHKRFLAAREELLAYSRRLGLVEGRDADGTTEPDLPLTVDTAEELLRLDARVKELWAAYQDAQGKQ
jgi:hypothetical protein